MKRILIIIFAGLVSTSGLIAQDYKKEWEDGKLTWEDFKEREGSGGQRISELNYNIGYNSRKQKFGNTVIKRYIAFGYMNKNLSWINPDYKTEQQLRYNQVIFDIVEVHIRKLQIELDRIDFLSEFDAKYQAISHSCSTEIERFNRETDGGNNLNSLVFWEQKIFDELNIYQKLPIPEFENKKFGYGMHIGLGTGLFTGTIREHFSPNFLNCVFGFDFAYKKSIFSLNGTLAGVKVTKDYNSENIWYKKQNVGLTMIDVSYGYSLLDNRKLKFTPFAGLGYTELEQKSDNKEDRLTLVDYNVILGLNMDYKIQTRINLVSISTFSGAKSKEKYDISIRSRLYVTRTNLTSDLKGYSVNLTIGLCGFGNLMRIK